MKAVFLLSALFLVLSFGATALAEPFTPACGGMLERISSARKALLPYRSTIEMARANESGAYGVVVACLGESRSSGDKPLPCRKSQWKAPTPTKADLAALDQYRQKREVFEDLFNQAKQICLLEP